ncbi:MAG: hypothetical protein GF334_02665 [Candidatus Altiarchaeales archaeon]|nr:hypothetical protein [Candidatus Altiarchaeales archaeon]
MDHNEILEASKRTAMSRKDPTLPMKTSLKLGLPQSPALDWGSGRGVDTRHLQSLEHDVFGYDPNYQPEFPETSNFQYGQCFYVLNAVPGEENRVNILLEMKKYLKHGATVIIAARPLKEVENAARKGKWTPCEDGWFSPKKTFQKGLSPEDLHRILQLAGFVNIVDHSNSRVTCAQATV